MNVDEFEKRFNELGKQMTDLIMDFGGEADEERQQEALGKLLASLVRTSNLVVDAVRTFKAEPDEPETPGWRGTI